MDDNIYIYFYSLLIKFDFKNIAPSSGLCRKCFSLTNHIFFYIFIYIYKKIYHIVILNKINKINTLHKKKYLKIYFTPICFKNFEN